jgi:proteasome beta subunit
MRIGDAGASFVDLLRRRAPETLPNLGARETSPHGTTIVAATWSGGVAMAGDRRATWGSQIAQKDIEKVFPADDWTLIGVAGAAGPAIDLVRLFQVELEHYEKIEGVRLSFDGKTNRLGGLLRGQLDDALLGLGVQPLVAGMDGARGRIVSFDLTGGRYEETGYHAIGSGAAWAKSSLKKLFRDDLSEEQVVTALVQALVDSADDDSATAGPDLVRGRTAGWRRSRRG